MKTSAREKQHTYETRLTWTGDRGTGTSSYTRYDRAHEISVAGKPVIPGSSDPTFRGDRSRYNPEELLVASLSACHMLSYLHLCSAAGVTVSAYTDNAYGIMNETADGGGHFKEVVLRPVVTVISDADPDMLQSLHERAHNLCFIANSVNFSVRCEAAVNSVVGMGDPL